METKNNKKITGEEAVDYSFNIGGHWTRIYNSNSIKYQISIKKDQMKKELKS